MTDSGGVQEEAPSFGRRLLLLRDNTERPEGLVGSGAYMVGSDKDQILRKGRELIETNQFGSEALGSTNPFGDGRASRRIVQFVADLDLTDPKFLY